MSVTPTPRTAEAEKSYWATGFATVVFDRMAELERDLARVTAERDERAERYRLTTLRQAATIAELTTDGNAATLAANLAAVSQRNAELVAALREAVGMLEELDGLDWGEEGMPFAVDFDHFAKLLARAESATPATDKDSLTVHADHIVDANKMVSATPGLRTDNTPAKHPDTDWLATLLESALKSFAAMPEANPSHTRDGIWALWTDGCNTLRDAIDAARKQEASK